MKKNRLFVLGIITMFVAILSLTLVSGTMARYTSTVSGSDDARVAKWAWVVGDEEIKNAATKKVTFGLFESYTDANVDYDGTGDETVIAPGTSSQFQFKIQNASEVNAEYTIVLSATETKDIPIEYSLTGNDADWVSDIAALNTQLKDKAIAMGVTDTSVTVYWRWVFEKDTAGNTTDTGLGFDANLGEIEVVVTAEITFNQVD